MTFSARDVSNIRCDCHRPGCAYCDMDGSLTKHQDERFEKITKYHSFISSKNEIKKMLYKQNPKAKISYVRKGSVYYFATISITFDDHKIKGFVPECKNIIFEIPVSDMGDADFYNEMDAKHLIRWIVNETENN